MQLARGRGCGQAPEQPGDTLLASPPHFLLPPPAPARSLLLSAELYPASPHSTEEELTQIWSFISKETRSIFAPNVSTEPKRKVSPVLLAPTPSWWTARLPSDCPPCPVPGAAPPPYPLAGLQQEQRTLKCRPSENPQLLTGPAASLLGLLRMAECFPE